jgi:hypothetical protein
MGEGIWLIHHQLQQCVYHKTILPADSRNTNSPEGGTSEDIPCQEDFFREEEGGLCFPRCETWTEYTDSEKIATDVVILSTAVIGVASGLTVIIISIIRSDRM